MVQIILCLGYQGESYDTYDNEDEFCEIVYSESIEEPHESYYVEHDDDEYKSMPSYKPKEKTIH